MAICKIVLIVAVIGSCRMTVGHEDVEYVAAHPYRYSYGVHNPATGDIKSHGESRDGDVVNGIHRLRLPDGSIQTVKYAASDATGFQAFVENSGGGAIVQSDSVASIARSAVFPTLAPVGVPVHPSPVIRSDARGFSYAFSTPVDNYDRFYQPPVLPYYYKPAVSSYQVPRYFPTPTPYQASRSSYNGQPYHQASRYQQPVLSNLEYLPPVERSGSNYVTFSSPHAFYSYNLK